MKSFGNDDFHFVLNLTAPDRHCKRLCGFVHGDGGPHVGRTEYPPVTGPAAPATIRGAVASSQRTT